ncbi:hypothetical protein HanPSC8_Chr03g0085161 [Helianthus annuus]|nr:hypothetical protein HanPSC8_Chr03g0085161 [Helianthus annuus]
MWPNFLHLKHRTPGFLGLPTDALGFFPFFFVKPPLNTFFGNFFIGDTPVRMVGFPCAYSSTSAARPHSPLRTNTSSPKSVITDFPLFPPIRFSP